MSESGAAARGPGRTGEGPEAEPDVLLDIPRVSVDSIRLAVDGLDADVSLRARLANLLQLDAGVRVHLERVELDVEGARAEAVLKVRLEKVLEILDRALSTIDRNPQVITALADTTNLTLNDVNRVADRMTDLTTSVVDRTGQPVGPLGQVTGRQVAPQGGSAADEAAGEGPGGEPAAASAGRTADQPAPTAPERPAGPRPESPAGPFPAGSPQEPPLAGRPSGQGVEGGRPADRGTTAGDHPRGEAEGGGRGEETGERGAERGGGRPGEGAEPPEVRGGEQQPGGTAQAGQLAGQAGETLRQAGRSVWEAIQGGMAQRRQGQQRRDR